jgi:hypothetical protein
MSRPSQVEWGSLRGARLPAQRRWWPIRWMGVKIVEVFIPQMKADVGGENLPCRQARRARRGARGTRKGKTRTRSTRRLEQREVSKLAALSSSAARPPRKPSSTRVFLARRRFVNWVDTRVNVIKADILAGLDVDDLLEWESKDFHPTLVPWDARRVTHVTRRLDGTFVPPWTYSVRQVVDWHLKRAWGRRCRLLRELAAKKGRAPPPLYVEKGLAVKLRTWYSGSQGRLPRAGFESAVVAPPPSILPTKRGDKSMPRERPGGSCNHRAHRVYTLCPSGHGVAPGQCLCPFCGWRR